MLTITFQTLHLVTVQLEDTQQKEHTQQKTSDLAEFIVFDNMVPVGSKWDVLPGCIKMGQGRRCDIIVGIHLRVTSSGNARCRCTMSYVAEKTTHRSYM